MSKTWNRWTDEQTAFLRKNYGKLSAFEIGKVVGRNKEAVYKKAEYMGLSCPGMFRLGSHIKPWDEKEVRRFLMLSTRLSDAEVARRMGRGVQSIKWMRNKYKVYHKPRVYEGRVRIDKTIEGGYAVRIYIGGRWMPMAQWRWERAYGPIPDGHLVITIDRNPLHCWLHNLECLPRAQHLSRINGKSLTKEEADAKYQLSVLKRLITEMK